MKEGKKWVTSPLDVAKEISKSLAANALISQVNGVLWDMTRPLEGDCALKLFTFDSDEGRDTFWHSSAHILGQVRQKIHLFFFGFQVLNFCFFFGENLCMRCRPLRWSMDASSVLDLAQPGERYVPR